MKGLEMKILLLGEYSGVHTNLRNALNKKGYEVNAVHNGDSYKSFEADIFINYKMMSSNNKIIQSILELYYLILVYSGFKGIFQIFKYYSTLKSLKGYNVVQLINTRFLAGFGPIVNFFVFRMLKKNNKKIFLCALGDDYFWVKYCLEKRFAYSMFDRLSFKTFRKLAYGLQYRYGFFNPYLNKYIVKNANAVIPGLYDYYIPYKNFKNCSDIVPIIIECKTDMPLKDMNEKYPIEIFHGWQTGKEINKGNDIFDSALKRMKKNYPEKVNYTIVGGVPYKEYINTFKSCHIFIDQCFSQDCGVNALLGMAEGKVVLSGFENNVREYYGIDYEPVINVKPDVDFIYSVIEKIVLNPRVLEDYSANALKFIKEFHNEDFVISKYLEIWKNY